MTKWGFYKKIALLAGASMLLLSGCAQADQAQSARDISDKYSVADENQLIVYTSHKEEVYLPIIEEFENRTGIYVELHAGGTQEMMQMASSAADKGDCDIMFGGGVESYEAWRDMFVSYDAFTELPIVFIYNKKLVNESMAPKTWQALFDGSWKGKIAFADMDNSGTSYTIIATISQMTGEPSDSVVEQVYSQLDGRVLKSSGDVIPDVSNGTSLVGITLEETALKAINKGYNIDMIYPEDGTSAVPDGCGILLNAPHMENAESFVEFIGSYETQQYAMDEFYRRPVLEDVELNENFGELKIIDFDVAKAAEDEPLALGRWHQLTGQED